MDFLIKNNHIILYYSGNLEIASISATKKMFNEILEKEKNYNSVVFSFKNIPHTDSTGISFIFSLKKELESKKIKVFIADIHESTLTDATHKLLEPLFDTIEIENI